MHIPISLSKLIIPHLQSREGLEVGKDQQVIECRNVGARSKTSPAVAFSWRRSPRPPRLRRDRREDPVRPASARKDPRPEASSRSDQVTWHEDYAGHCASCGVFSLVTTFRHSIIRFSKFFLCGVSLRVPGYCDVCLLFSFRGLSRWRASDFDFYYTLSKALLSTPFSPPPRPHERFLSLKGAIGACVPGHSSSGRSRLAMRG